MAREMSTDSSREEGPVKDWQPGDLVQIDPEHGDGRFAACILTVTEVRSWGAIGFVRVPDVPSPGDAYYRLPWDGGERVGAAVWMPATSDSENPNA